ncbi:MAG TPA: ATP-binding protein [Fibrobacteria bacterium]|nr:ATP-binding protein [Fibrobacteria bacterium]
MKDLIRDIELLKAGLAEGRDVAELGFGSEEVAALARDLAKRYSRIDTQAKRRIRSASASLSRAQLEKEQYKSSLSELQKILDLCRVISSSLDLKDILHHLLFLLSEILPSRGCAVFVGGNRNGGADVSPGGAPLLASNFTPALQQILAQHFEEGIIRWILNERRVCLIPSFDDRLSDGAVSGDFAVVPLNDNDSNYGFIWIACTIKQEAVTPETTNLIWVLSSHASIAIMNCLHRQRMEEKLNELKLLTSINALKGEILRQGAPREETGGAEAAFGGAGGLPAFFREFQRLISRELKLDKGHLISSAPDGSLSVQPALAPLDSAPFAEHAETRKLLRLADKEQVRLEAGDFFLSSYPRVAKALGSAGLALLSLSPAEGPGAANRGAYLLLPLSADDMQRIPLLQTLLLAVASQARVVAENIDLYDSLLAANRNLTALQWQLVHSGKMAALGQLAGGVAHEINNPLQIMLGRIQMIQMMAEEKQPAGKAKLKDELNLVTEEVLRIRDIVRNLLDFSRQGKRETAFSPVSLNDTLQDVLALLQHQLISNQVEVKLSLDPENVRILGNRNQLKQVFINLMMNAVHAMEKEPRVLEITTFLRDGMVTASVRDSGVGISQENISRIFEPFFSTKSMGTGLGLSISYGLIKEHKGTIEVESQEARGTCFTIRLPKISEESLGYNLLVG